MAKAKARKKVFFMVGVGLIRRPCPCPKDKSLAARLVPAPAAQYVPFISGFWWDGGGICPGRRRAMVDLDFHLLKGGGLSGSSYQQHKRYGVIHKHLYGVTLLQID